MSSDPDRMDIFLSFLGERPDPGEAWIFDDSVPADSPVNSLALGTLALLAYSGSDGIRTFLAQHGFPGDAHFLTGDNTFGFAAQLGVSGPLFISYRGTEPTMLAEVAADLNYAQLELNGLPGTVHGGFGRAFSSVRKDTEDALKAFPDATCYFTGHSLGGAIAVLAAAAFRDRAAAVCTYGQPRVGDTVFSGAYDQELGEMTFRFVNNYDIIPHVPPVKLPASPSFPRDIPESFNNLLSGIEQGVRNFLAGETFAHVGQLRLFIDGTFPSDPISGQTVSDDPDDFDRHDLIGTQGLKSGNLVGALLDEANIRANEFRGLPDHDPKHGYLPRLKQRAMG